MKYNDVVKSVRSTHSLKNGLTFQTLKQFVANAPLTESSLKPPTSTLSDDDLQKYLQRVQSQTRHKSDKYKYPFIHGNNVPIVDDAGKLYDLAALRDSVTQRPDRILGQNKKMQNSDGTTIVFFNIGLPALKGLAVNEDTGEFVIVDTCPGAGACKTFCYAMSGNYIRFAPPSMRQTRMLNFLLNDPEGFSEVLSAELIIARHMNKKSKIVVRWHDAGDFFSPEYLKMAFDVAKRNPTVDFYSYTKIADVAMSNRPSNFKMNFSGGAHRSQEKRIDFKRTKHAKVVPAEMFDDLVIKKSGRFVKDADGRMQFNGVESFNEFKRRLATKYHIPIDTIVTYRELMALPVGNEMKLNVIVSPGDGDDSANRSDVLGTYLTIH